MMSQPTQHRHENGSRTTDEKAEVPVIEAISLLKGGSKIAIEHQGEHYLLRLTRNGKLILTK
jgi:hemin uptake protein HemP